MEKTISIPDNTPPANVYVCMKAYARLKQKIGQLQDARELYKTAIKLDPQNVLAYQVHAAPVCRL